MSNIRKNIKGGIYLVIDPAMQRDALMDKLKLALAGGIDVLQIWNNWPEGIDRLSFIKEISILSHPYQIPLLINQEWTLLKESSELDGVHFDVFPDDLSWIKTQVTRDFMIGVTCSGNLDTVRLAHKDKLDYISFCSMFPSSSAGSCDIVLPETVSAARELTHLPLFVSGGITPENADVLSKQIPFDGVAVISGILSADNPVARTRQYQQVLTTNSKIL
ncbi:thiamine phosphate synthase [Pedobacter frigidisoli]|uniref:thiamine phosphate synthase n=1 Tax=Pedobacter frigidisoli TaxID=2530455 RepID=UPI0029304B64|nr:thiamine phosphate synthase [Pedobacter frigidisoli]